MSNENYLGRNIRILCSAYDYSYGDLAKKVGVHPSHISRMSKYDDSVKGARPSLTLLIKIAEVFETDLETLIRMDLIGELKAKISKKSQSPSNSQ
mgnify:CR=1 FL=1